jgi:DNA-binding NtrC family response regulator
VVAATNRDLAAEARAGRFREDLYYRLAVVELIVPPLRDHREDIPPLADEFARFYGEKFGMGPLSLEPALIEALTREGWPGNVRQLENTIARLAALSSGGLIGLADFNDHVPASTPGRAQTSPGTSSPGSSGSIPLPATDDEPAESRDLASGPSLREQVEAFERGIIARALDGCGGNQSEAARRLGVSRVTLIDKMKKYGLTSRRT